MENLKELIAVAEGLNQSDYTPASWASFSAMLTNANLIYDMARSNVPQDVLNNTYITLNMLINRLVKV